MSGGVWAHIRTVMINEKKIEKLLTLLTEIEALKVVWEKVEKMLSVDNRNRGT